MPNELIQGIPQRVDLDTHGVVTSNILSQILENATHMNATDVHLQVGSPVIFRLNKHLVQYGKERLTADQIESMLFTIMNDAQKASFKAHMQHDFSYGIKGVARFRVNVFRQRETMAAAIRKIPYEIPALEKLGVPTEVMNLAKLPRGLVLVTGPTGQGKSTTLAAIIDRINIERDAHIITIEDPIEYLFQHKKSIIVQRELGTDTESFSDALRSALREDPDVLLVGEMRDFETISAALTAAETGHLVFATLHTNSASQTIDRIVDVFPPHQQQQIRVQLSGVLSAIMTQQLLPKKDKSGVILCAELLISNTAIKNLIREGKTFQIPSVIQTGGAQGMITMDASMKTLYEHGMVSLDTCLDYAFDLPQFKKSIGIC